MMVVTVACVSVRSCKGDALDCELCVKMRVLVVQSGLTLCSPMDCSLPGSSVHGILQARILEWIAMPFSRVFSWPRDQTQVYCTAGRFFAVRCTGLVSCTAGICTEPAGFYQDQGGDKVHKAKVRIWIWKNVKHSGKNGKAPSTTEGKQLLRSWKVGLQDPVIALQILYISLGVYSLASLLGKLWITTDWWL